MTFSDDPMDEMARFLSPDRAERLLTGADAPDDLPDGAARVARLFSSLGSRGAAEDPTGEQRAITAIAAAIGQAPVPLTPHRRRRMLPQLLSAKAAAAAVAAILAGTTAAAAAGSLPDPAQKAVSRTLSHVDISVPSPDDQANDQVGDNADHAPADATDTGNANATGPDATGPAMYGLCTAWAAGPSTANPNSRKASSVAFSNLQKAADKAGMSVAEYCKDARPGGVGTSTTTTSTPPVAAEHGPRVSTPNRGGTGNAPPAAGAGSGNADNHPRGRP